MVNGQQSGLLIVVLVFLLAVIAAVGWVIYTSVEPGPGETLVGQVQGVTSETDVVAGTPVEVRYPTLAINQPEVSVFAPRPEEPEEEPSLLQRISSVFAF